MQYRVSMLRISLMLPYVFGLKREFLWYRTCKRCGGGNRSEHWTPTIYQDVNDSCLTHADIPARLDYNGDWRGDNK